MRNITLISKIPNEIPLDSLGNTLLEWIFIEERMQNIPSKKIRSI